MIKKLNRILAVFMAAAVLFTLRPYGAEAKTFNDVSPEYAYADAISSLVSLNLLAGYEDGSFKPENTITRAEFSAVIARALGMDTFVTPTDLSAVFTDMTNADGSYHWSSGYVSFAYKKEIIAGMGDGTFAPDVPVTYEQAVKMIVCTLGYGTGAEEYGGWPAGYIRMGDNLGITKGAVVSPTDTPASRGLVAKLVDNALDVKIAEKNSSGAYEETEKTLLKDKLKVNEFKNMMITEVDGETTINASSSGIKAGEILLENGTESLIVSYAGVATSAELKSKIGYYISGYYKTNEDDENTLISIDSSSTKNMELTIKSDNIDSYGNFKIEYWTNKDTDVKTKRATLSDEIKLIYNGMIYDYSKSSDPEERTLEKWLDPNSEDFVYGSIRLLDSDGDAYYDAVFMDDYEVYVVKSAVTTTDTIAANNYVVYDYYNTARKVTLDPLDESVTISIKNDKTGASLKVDALKAMNILSVAKSMDETMYSCYVSSTTVSGTITQVSPKNHIYIINNTEYELTNEFAAVVDSGKETLDINTTGTFYLDMFGRIAAVKATAAQVGSYGYITIGAMTGSAADVATVKLISLTSSPSTPTKTNLADKVKINGKTYSDPDSALAALEASASLIKANSSDDAGNALYSQPVRYIKNSAGAITSINTVQEKNGSIEMGTNTDTSKVQMGRECETLLYNGSGNFANTVFINSSTKVIVVPDNRTDDSGYKRFTGFSSFKTSTKYDVEAYDVNTSGIASMIVVYGADTSSPITSDTKLCIVKSISTKSSTISDEICFDVEVYEEGVLKSYETEDNSDKYKTMAPGDVVRFGYNGDGQINEVQIEADCDNLVFESKHDKTMYNGDYKFKTVLGTVATKSDELIMIAPSEVVYTPSDEENPDIPESGETGEGEEVEEGAETATVTEAGYSLDESAKEGYNKTSSTKIYRVITNGSDVTIEPAPWDSIVAYADVENDTASVAFAHAYVNNLKLVVIYVVSK